MVYVPQKSSKNLSSALEYGQLQVMFPDGNMNVEPKALNKRIYEALSIYTPKEDYIMLIGDPLLIALISHAALNLGSGVASFLKWDRIQGRYSIVDVII